MTLSQEYPTSQDDIIIAVMGATGAGKSSFIQMATKNDLVTVGHNLNSCTDKVQAIRCTLPGSKVVFLDTPGFDDTKVSDAEILGNIADWLTNTYRDGIKLTGILYLQRISDNRISGTSRRNMQMFQLLCGHDALQNVTLVTTMWNEVDDLTGSRREDELRERFWGDMIEAGSKVVRFEYTYESAWDILDQFSGLRRPLQLQVEMVDQGKSLGQTAAGSELFRWFTQFMAELRALIQSLKRKLRRPSKGSVTSEELEEKLTATKDKLKRADSQRKKVAPRLSLPIPSILQPSYSQSQPSSVFRPSKRRSSFHTLYDSPSSVVAELPEFIESPLNDHTGGTIRGLAVANNLLRHGVAVAEMVEVPFLKGILEVSSTVLKSIESLKRNDHALVGLAHSIRRFHKVISEETDPRNMPKEMRHALRELAKELEAVQRVIWKIASQNRVQRYFLQPDDENILVSCSSSMNDAYDLFMMRCMISIHREILNLRHEGFSPRSILCPPPETIAPRSSSPEPSSRRTI
ncbi:hypothetical protein CPB86DRAFT_262479 [Serendipita vermifera]|nr:hypothetical protein CPB86DRAFT_262479 [Serendipita vermifera]